MTASRNPMAAIQDHGAALVAALNNSFHADTDLRLQAEDNLRNFEKTFGDRLVPVLLDAVSESRLEIGIRQAAVLRVKSLIVQRFARRSDDEVPAEVSHDHLLPMRQQTIAAVFATASIRSLHIQLLEAVNLMIRSDYPDTWPNLIESLVPYLTDSNPCHVVGALSILRLIFRKYQHSKECATPALPILISSILPIVQRILADCLQHLHRPESLELARLCFKIYHHAIRQPMPASVRETSSFMAWFRLCLHVICIAPNQSDPGLKHLKAMQKRALICLVPLLNMYGRCSVDQDASEKQFSTLYMESVAPHLLDAVVHVLQRPMVVLSRPILQSCFAFLSTALAYASLYRRLRPHLQSVLVDGIFRTLCLTDYEVDLFDSDGAEFSRRGLDAQEAFDDPRINASNMLIDLVRVRTSDVFPGVMHLITSHLTNPENDHLFIDGALSVFGSLSRVLMSKQGELPPAVLGTFLNQVIPLLAHRSAIVQTRCIWVCGRYAALPEAEQCIAPVFELLRRGKAIPVVTAASIAFSELLRAHGDAIDQLKDHLPIILEQYVSLIDTVGNESVISTLEDIVGRFPPATISPFVLRLTEKLIAVFSMHVFTVNDVESSDEKQFAAMGMIRVICALFECCRDKPDLYMGMEALCIPTLHEILYREQYVMQLESAVDLLRVMSGVSPVPFASFLSQSYAVEYVNSLVPIFRNFMARNTSAFYRSADVMPLVQMCNFIMTCDEAAHDSKYAAQILEGLAGFCAESVPHTIRTGVCASITQVASEVFVQSLEKACDDFTFEVFCSMLSNVLCYAIMLSPEAFYDSCRPTVLLPAWIRFIPSMTWELSEFCLASLTFLLSFDWNSKSNEDRELLGKVLGSVPSLCSHVVSEINAAGNDSDEDENIRRPTGSGLKDIRVDEDWNSDDEDEFCDYDEEEFIDEGAELPELDLQELFKTNMQKFNQVQQWQSSLNDSDRLAIHQYITSPHGKERPN